MRNRERVLEAALRMFRQHGPDIAMEDIARQAGVGVGTLYRRFPDRNALILAVIREGLTKQYAALQRASDDDRSAWEKLTTALIASIGLDSVVRLMEQLPPERARFVIEDDEVRKAQGDLVLGMDQLVRAAQAEGSLRSDVGTVDVLSLFEMLLETAAHRPNAIANIERSMVVILDGLRAEPQRSVLPLAAGDVASLLLDSERIASHAKGG